MARDETGTASPVAFDARNVYGPRAISALLPALTRPAFRRHGSAVAQVLADWRAIVGPELAGITQPRRLSAGTLTIACSGPVALELQHLAPELMARINGHLGGEPVQRLRFVATVLKAATPSAAIPAPNPQAARAAAASVGDFPAGALRDALIGLGAAVRGRPR